MERTYKNVISFGLNNETFKTTKEDEFEKIKNYSIKVWKIFFKRQRFGIRIINDPIEVKKMSSGRIRKFIIQYPRSTEKFIVNAFKEKNTLATCQIIFRDDGTALIKDDLSDLTLSYGGAWQIMFKQITGQSFLEKLKLRTEEELNYWVLEKSQDIKLKDRPELFLYNYIK